MSFSRKRKNFEGSASECSALSYLFPSASSSVLLRGCTDPRLQKVDWSAYLDKDTFKTLMNDAPFLLPEILERIDSVEPWFDGRDKTLSADGPSHTTEDKERIREKLATQIQSYSEYRTLVNAQFDARKAPMTSDCVHSEDDEQRYGGLESGSIFALPEEAAKKMSEAFSSYRKDARQRIAQFWSDLCDGMPTNSDWTESVWFRLYNEDQMKLLWLHYLRTEELNQCAEKAEAESTHLSSSSTASPGTGSCENQTIETSVPSSNQSDAPSSTQEEEEKQETAKKAKTSGWFSFW